jgi:tripartite-type tricarboxylate transporter receptor subunit TctC
VRAGTIKPYAITARTRIGAAPEIPTAEEAGVPGFQATLWYGLWVPKDTPKEIIAKLNATMIQTLAEPAVKTRFAELGLQAQPRDQQTPEALRAFQRQEAEKWWPIIKAADIKPQ